MKKIEWLAMIMIGVVMISCKSERQNSELLYNSHTVDITPDKPVLLAGFANRQGLSDTIHHALVSRCVMLQYDTTKVCLITNDLMEISSKYVAAIKEKIHEATNFPQANIIVTASHTHSAPIMDEMGLGWSDANEDYKQHVIAKIADNAIQVLKDHSSAVACSLRTGRSVSAMNTSRRSIDPETGESSIGESDDKVDQEIRVLQLEDSAEHPLSTWFNYACHPVVLGFPSRAVSPDFVGEARDVVTEKWGGDALFLNGAAGDINPKHGLSASLKLADDIGAEFGAAVLQTELKKDTVVPIMKYIHSNVQLPYRDQNITPAFIDEQVILKSAQKTEFVHWENDVKKWGERMKADIKTNGSLPNYREAEISVLKIGSSVILFVQGEFFNSYQVRLKQKFPMVHLIFAGYSHGESGYIPDSAAFAEKGYEVDQAYIYIHEPSPLSPRSEQIAMDKMAELIEQVL